MSESIAQRFDRLAAGFADRIADVPPGRWDSPTPCEGWSAADLVQHVVDAHGVFLGVIGRSLPDGIPAAEADPAGAFDAARRAVQACLDDPEVAGTGYDSVVGTMTFESGVDGFLSFDLNVHAWDLARTVGVEHRIHPAEVTRLHGEAESFPESMRGQGGSFAHAVEPPEGADEQARLLAFLGRDPS